MSGDIKSIQQALKDRGFDPGDIDGIWGRKTIGALRSFQQKNGLETDGIVGPEVMTALFGAAPAGGPALASGPLVWFEEAHRQMGLKEVKGPRSNKTILDWADDLDVAYPNDDIAWCGLFVAHCIGSTLPGEALPSNPLGARNWSKFGQETKPRLGAVMVFWRESLKNSFKGHVAFYAGEDATAYQVLGGNQSDSVSVARIAKDRLITARWPTTAAALTSAPVMLAAGQSALSANEA